MVKGKIRKSIRYSFFDGGFASVMLGIAESYFNPYALALGASGKEIGLLTSLPGVSAALAQVKAPEVIEKFGRKKIVLLGVFLQVLTWIPIVLLPFLGKENLVPWLIFFVVLYALSGNFAGPAWGSIIAQYVFPSKRSSFFAQRNRFFALISLGSVLFGGTVLYLFNKKNLYGFSLIFSFALLCRFISWLYLRKYYEPHLAVNPESRFSLWDFIKRIKESNFVRFVFLVSLISFAVNLAAPFFPYYMLRERGFDYLSYALIFIIPILVTLVVLPRWGKHADIVGNLRVIKSTVMFVPLIPLLWLFSANKFYLIGVQTFAGFLWAGYNLCTVNFIYDAVSPEKRARCLAYFNFLNGSGLFLGATLGGYLFNWLPKIFAYRSFNLFFFSGIIRLVVVGTLLPKIKEVRAVRKISSSELFFSIAGIKPVAVLSE